MLLCAGAPIAAGLGWYAWHNRSLPGARSFAILIFLAALWVLMDGIELMAQGMGPKLFWTKLEYLPKSFVPVAWLTMVLDYSGRRPWSTRKLLAALCFVPVLTQPIIWTNGYHRLVFSSVWLEPSGLHDVLLRTPGPWFWVITAHAYLLLAVGLGLLISAAATASSLHRRQPVALLIGCCIPIVFNIVQYFASSVMPKHDYTPGSLALAGVVISWGLFRIRVFNLVPVARHALVENMSDGVLVLDQADRVIDLNASAKALIGLPSSQILGRQLADCWEAWSQMVRPHAAGVNHAELQLGEDDHRTHYEVKWSPLTRRKQIVGRIVALRDVTDRVHMEENLRQQALSDSLTGLPNRALFMARLEDAIRQARRRRDSLFAVMVLDLDRFKLINDSIGHLAGDVLLQNVATKLRRCVRETDTVARMGGDEFMILLHPINSARDLLPVLDRIQDDLRSPVFFRQQEMTAGSSVGVVIWDASYEDPEDLLRAADTAMYQAKEAGRGCHRIFDEEMHKTVLETLKAETDLRVAIRQHDFSIAYQPIVDLDTGSVVSLEAFLRWHHSTKGIVMPDDFIHIAENSGLIVPLGVLALDEVCSRISRWPGSAAADLSVSLNLSPRQLVEPDFVATIVRRLEEWGLPADRLMFEITEAALVRDPLKSKQVMRELGAIGIRLCLDDFGTGWSSLQHLTTFPVQELKIDGTFISKLARGNTEFELVRSLVGLARALGLTVTAEGVERSEQWMLLRELQCHRGQGYYMCAPLEAVELVDYLEDVERGSCMLAQRPGAPRGVATEPAAEPERVPSPAWMPSLPACGEEG